MRAPPDNALTLLTLESRWSRLPAFARAWGLAAFIAGTAVYAPTVGHGFVVDDHIVVVKNRNLRSLAGLRELVTSTEWAGGGVSVRSWRPLTALTYAANHAVTGLRPWSYHLLNALLHGAVAVLLFRVGVLFGLAPPAAGLAALLFAVHPLHVEAVSNVIGRKDVLATLFLLAMLASHGWAARRGGLRLLVPILAYAAAMSSKEVGAVGLALVLLWDLTSGDSAWSGSGKGRRRAVGLHVAYAFALAGYLVLYRSVTAGATDEIPLMYNPLAHAALPERLLTAVAVIGKGLLLHLWPAGQSPDWSYAAIPLATRAADPRVLLTALALVAWAGLAVRYRVRAPILAFALGWYGAAMAPVANVLFPIGTIFGERLLYLPSAAIALAAGWAIHALVGGLPKRSSRAVLAAGVGAVALLAIAAVRYSAVWKDELSLYTWAAQTAPGSTKVHHNLASMLLSVGRKDEALAEIDLALRILPSNGRAELQRAAILREMGRDEEADRSTRQAARLLPEDPDAAYAEGVLERTHGRLDAAAERWRRAVALDPGHPSALADLAGYHLLRGELQVAMRLAERAVGADEGSASAWYNLAVIHQSLGDMGRSRGAFARFVETAGGAYSAEAVSVREMLDAGGPWGPGAR